MEAIRGSAGWEGDPFVSREKDVLAERGACPSSASVRAWPLTGSIQSIFKVMNDVNRVTDGSNWYSWKEGIACQYRPENEVEVEEYTRLNVLVGLDVRLAKLELSEGEKSAGTPSRIPSVRTTEPAAASFFGNGNSESGPAIPWRTSKLDVLRCFFVDCGVPGTGEACGVTSSPSGSIGE